MIGTAASVTHVRERIVLSRGEVHELAGPLSVEAGGELVIEAGARIEARPGVSLTIQRDGALIANGTLLEPIIMTCTSVPRYAGCWRGLRVHGFARLNFGTADSPADPQGGGAGCLQAINGTSAYGGCADTDSSGALRYLRIEYAFEGLRLLGVGSRTRLQGVQVNRSLGDGLAIVGGAVDLRQVFLTANGGYGLSWRAGWRGRGQFLVVQQDANGLAGGISGSNAGGTGGGSANLPRSEPTLYNITVIAPSAAAPTAERPALHFREGTGGIFRNILVHSSALVLDLDNEATCNFSGNADGVSIRHLVLAANVTLGSPDVDPSGCAPYASPTVEAQLLSDGLTATVVVTDPVAIAALLRNPTNLIVPDFRPNANGSASTSPAATPPIDGFFDVTANYVGAVTPANASRNNVPWYSGWTVAAPEPPAPGTVSGIVSPPQGVALANVVISATLGIRDTTDANGAFSLLLPAGQHVLSLSGLPVGCSATPVSVNSPAGGAVMVDIAVACTLADDVVVGSLHACLMARDRRLQCWGQNDFGMVGDCTNTSPRLLPVWAAENLPYDAFSLSAGITHTCATRTSSVFCWGLNFFGALGLGTTGFFSTTPISVGTTATPTFLKVSNGGFHSCALTNGGEAWCWGWNAEGQVGANSPLFSLAVPTAVAAGTTRFTSLALGESHSCGLTAEGAAWCWGGNARSESGRDTAGANVKSLVPVPVSTSLAFTTIDAGTLHSCALTADGSAYCWGSREFGQLGDGSTGGVSGAPVAVHTTEKFTQIAAGGFTTCGVTVTHRVLCWGAGASGALGNGSDSPVQATPVAVNPALDVRRVAVNLAAPEGTTVCAVTRSDAVFCWGAGTAGQLGNGTTISSTAPVQVLVRGSL